METKTTNLPETSQPNKQPLDDWRQVPGDIDDFIFFDQEPQQSER